MILDDLGLSETDRVKLEKILLDFDENWNSGSLTSAFSDLIGESDEFSQVALLELIKIDLHRQWAAGNERKVESYRSELETVGLGGKTPTQLALAEFLARHAAGLRPKAKEFRDRFPNQFDEFRRLLEAEQSRRSGLEKVQASISTDAGKAAIDTKTENHVDPHSLPETFGRYTILRRLGAGAMGAVYLAHDTQLDRHVALKTPSFGGGVTDELIQRFYREARAAANLRHPNICPVFDVGQIDGRHYITMAFIEGKPLSNYIAGAYASGNKPLEQKAIAGIVRKLALALADAHAAGVIHRDLKPANVMVDQKRQPLVMDFGLAHREDEMQSRMTQSGAILGTPAYMSPEQVKGNIEEIGPQADVYSLGVILYELLTGRLPFEGGVAAVIGQILTEPPEPPSHSRADIDRDLEAICLKMMAKQQIDRFESMNQVAAELGAYIKGQATNIGPASSPASSSPAASAPIIESPVTESQAVARSSNSPPMDPADILNLAQLPESLADPHSTQTTSNKPAVPFLASGFWKTGAGKAAIAGVTFVALLALAWGITIVFRTPYGTLTIKTDDPNIAVAIDGKLISITDNAPIKFLDGTHDLSLRIGDQNLPIGSSVPFQIVGREGHYRLATTYKDTELRSNLFNVNKGKKSTLSISLAPVPTTSTPPPAPTTDKASDGKIADSTAKPPNAGSPPPSLVPRTPLPDGPAGEVRRMTGHQNSICTVRFTPDGKRLVSNSTDKSLRVWDIVEEKQIHSVQTPSACRDLAVSPDGRFAVSCGVGGHIGIYDLDTGTLNKRLIARGGLYMGVDFSPDGKRVAAANLNQLGRIWDVEQGDLLFQFPIKSPDNAECNIHFTKDGKQLLVAPFAHPGVVELINASDGVNIEDLPVGGRASSGKIALSPDGQRFVSGNFDGSIIIFDLVNRKQFTRVVVGRGSNVVAYSPDGRWIASGQSNGNLFVVDTKTLTIHKQFRHGQAAISSIDFSPDSRFLATGNSKSRGDIRVWRINNSPTGESTASTSPAKPLAKPPSKSPNTVAVSPPTLSKVLQPSFSLLGHTEPIGALAVAADGRHFASSSSDKTVRVWDSISGRQIGLATAPAHVWRVDFAPDDSGRLAICCDDGSVLIWQTDTRLSLWDAGTAAPWNTGTLTSWNTKQKNTIDVHFSPNGKMLATAGDDGTAKIWDVQSRRLIRTFNALSDRCTVVRFTPDGRHLLAGGKKGPVKVWEILSAEQRASYKGHAPARPMVFCADVSPDGRLAVSAGNDRKIHVWEIGTGKPIRTLEGHQSDVVSVQFAPDGQTLVSGSFDGTFRIWDIESGQQIQQGNAEHNGTNIAVFDHDAKAVISAGGLNGNWKPVGQYVIRTWSRDGTISKPSDTDSTKDYHSLLTGQWVSWYQDLVRQSDGKTTTVVGDAVEMKDGTGWQLEKQRARNSIIRARVKKTEHGGDVHKPYLILRYLNKDEPRPKDKGRRYRTYLRGWQHLGIDKLINDKWVTLEEKDLGRKLDQYFEWTLAAIDNQFKVYIDGKLILDVNDPTSIEHGYPFFATGGRARLKAVEVMVLDEVGKIDSLINAGNSADKTRPKNEIANTPTRPKKPTTGPWMDLFDGRSLDGWLEYTTGRPVTSGWVARDGELYFPTGARGNIMTRDQFGDFELEFEWKISAGGNSGVFYRAQSGDPTPQTHGLEYQVFDDASRPNLPPMNKSAAIYGLTAPSAPGARPLRAGEWNTARIVARGNQIEHWLNGVKVAEIQIGSRRWNRAIRKSKAKKPGDFGKSSGHIVLQDHNSAAWYRNIRVRRLGESSSSSPPAKPPSNNLSASVLVPSAKPFEQLNKAASGNAYPSLTQDGLQIVWTREGGATTVPEVWIASRSNRKAPFANPRKLFNGRHATLSGDGLDLIFIEPRRGSGQPQRLKISNRLAVTESFSAPVVIPSFEKIEIVKSPSLSGDGKTLIFQRNNQSQNQKDVSEFLVTSRSSREPSAPWDPPRKVELQTSSLLPLANSWPWLSDDRLSLWFCQGGHIEDSLIVKATRSNVRESFGNFQFLEIDGQRVAGRGPRFLDVTGQLYYSAPVKPLRQGSHDLHTVLLPPR